jgi:hypothetical protein
MTKATTTHDLYGMVDKIIGLDEELLRVDPETVIDVRARDLLRPLQKQAEGLRLLAQELEDYLHDTLVATKPAEKAGKSDAKKK